MEKHERLNLNYQLLGWILFIVCAFFFIASSFKNGDTLTLIGSIIFFIACGVFLIPLLRDLKIQDDDNIDEVDDDKLQNN